MATIQGLGLQPRTKNTNGLDKLHRLGIGYVNEELDRAPEPDYSFIPTPQKESPEDFSAIPLPPQKVKLGQRKEDTAEKVREYYSAPPTRFDKIIMGSDAAEMVFGDLATFGEIQPDTEERLNVLQKSGAKAAGSAWDLLLDSVGYASALAGRDDIAKNISDIKKRNLAPARLPSSRKEFDVSDLTKPDFWAEQAPATIALYLAASTGGTIGGSAATSLAARFGLSGKAAQVAKFAGQIFGGTIPMTGAEAFMEASGTYNQALESMLQSGKSEKEAQEKASEVAANTFTSNLAFLAGTNAFEYYTALGKLPRGLRNKFTRYVIDRANGAGIQKGGRRAVFGALNVAGKVAAAPVEGAEEVLQGWIQKTAQDYVDGTKPDAGLEIKDLLTKIEEMKPDTQAEILVGLGMGLLFQAGGSFEEYSARRKKLERKAKTNPQELKRDLEKIVTEEEDTKQALSIPTQERTVAVEPDEDEKVLNEIAQQAYGKSLDDLPIEQRTDLEKRYVALSEKAAKKKIDDLISERVGLKKAKAEKSEKGKAQPPVAEAAVTTTAADRTAPAAVPVAQKESINVSKILPRTPQEIDADILDRTLELERSGASAQEMRDDPVLKALDNESREVYAENERARREFLAKKEKEESPPSQPTVAPAPSQAIESEGAEPQPSKTAVVEKPTHKEFDRALKTFQEVAAKQAGKPVPEQSAAIAEELRKQNVNPVIIDELTNPRRAPRPRNPETERSATSRPERIARAANPSPTLKPKVDAIAQANVDFRNKEAALLKAREEIKADIEARGGEVVVDTDTGAMTITLKPGRAKISEADQALIERLRAEAAEAGAYSLATVGQGFEVSATPERIADAESLPAGDFKARALEFLRRNAEAKAAEKVFKQAKEDARNDLVDYYLAELVAGKETPSALLGVAKDGTKVEIMARRVRSAAEPDLTIGGRNFPQEIAEAKQKAQKKAGEPFIEARKAGEKKVTQAKERGAFVAESKNRYGKKGYFSKWLQEPKDSEKVILKSSNTPRKSGYVSGVYVSLDRGYASDYASGLIDSAGSRKYHVPRDGVIFTIALDEEIRPGRGDVFESDWIGINEDLKQLRDEGSVGSYSNEKLFGIVGIDEDNVYDFIDNPDYFHDSISMRDYMDFQQGEQGYSEGVVENVKWNQIVRIERFDENGKLVEDIEGPAAEKFDDDGYSEDGSFIVYSGSPAQFWEPKSKKTSVQKKDTGDKLTRYKKGDVVTVKRDWSEIFPDESVDAKQLTIENIDKHFHGQHYGKTVYTGYLSGDEDTSRRIYFVESEIVKGSQKAKELDTELIVPEKPASLKEQSEGYRDSTKDDLLADYELSLKRLYPKTTTVGKEIHRNKIPNIDEALNIVADSESNQGRSLFPEKGENFDENYHKFKTKNQARRYVKEEVLPFFKGLPDVVPIYRAVQAKDVQFDYVGESWTFDLNAAKTFGLHNGSNNIIKAYVPKSNIDFEQSISSFHNFSSIGDSDSEFEVFISYGSRIDVVSVDDIKQARELPSLGTNLKKEGYQPNRPGDFLFNPEAVFEQKPYEPNYKKRPDATPRTDRLAKEFMDELGKNRKRGRVYLANAIDASARENGQINLNGQRVRTSDDLAVVGQVARDPRVEQLRYVLVKEGKVIGSYMVGSRLPSATAAFPYASTKEGIAWLNGLMEETGADGYYMLHNHPSGEVDTSGKEDMDVTETVSSGVEGFKGHVIIDSNVYATITRGKDGSLKKQIKQKFFGEDKLLKPSIDNPLIGRKAEDANDLMAIGKSVQAPEGWVTVVGATPDSRIRGIAEVEEALLQTKGKRRAAVIRKFARDTGSANVFLVADQKFFDANKDTLMKAVELGFITDAVSSNGDSIHSQFPKLRKENVFFGKEIEAGRVVKEGAQEIPDTITVDGKERPTRNSKGQLIHSTRKGIENFWKWFGDSKVVDEQGRPLVVYHGTKTSGFDIFDFSKSSPEGRVYFAVKAEKAGHYATDLYHPGRESVAPGVYPVFLKIDNPIDLDAYVKSDKMYEGLGRSVDSWMDAGYDGAHVTDEPGIKAWIAFTRNQIKSAIGNRGTFSPDEPSIVRESESTYGKAGLNREQFLDLGVRLNDFLQDKENVDKLTEAERKEFAVVLGVLKEYGELSKKADLSQKEQRLLRIALSGLESKDGKRVISNVQKALEEGKPGWRDAINSGLEKIAEWSGAMKLWRLSSVAGSAGGNLFSSVLVYPDLRLSAWFNKGIAKRSNVALTRFSDEARIHFRSAWMSGEIKNAAQQATDIMKEKPGAEKESKFLEREHIRKKAIKGWYGKYIRASYNAQGAIDVLYRKPMEVGFIAVESFREGMKDSKTKIEGAKNGNVVARNILRVRELRDAGKEIPKSLEKYAKLLQKAESDAEYRLFQSQLTGIAKKLGDFRRYPAVRILAPFYNTGMNILKQAYERTPLSAFQKEFMQLSEKLLKKTLTAEEAGRYSDRAAQITLGTLVSLVTTALLYAIADDDEELITGNYDPKTIGDKPLGWQPNSIRIGDTYVSTKMLQPFSTIFTAIGETMNNKDGYIAGGTKALADAYFVNPMTEELFDVISAIRPGENKPLTKSAEEFFVDLVVGSATPGILNDIAKITDPVVRQKHGFFSRLRGKIGIPGASLSLPPRIDPFGEDLIPQTRGEKTVKTLTGLSFSKVKEDPARKELRSLGLNHDVESITHKGVKLEPWEAIELNKSIGQAYRESILKLLQNPYYLSASVESRKKKLNMIRQGLIDKQKKYLERESFFIERERNVRELKEAEKRLFKQMPE